MKFFLMSFVLIWLGLVFFANLFFNPWVLITTISLILALLFYLHHKQDSKIAALEERVQALLEKEQP